MQELAFGQDFRAIEQAQPLGFEVDLLEYFLELQVIAQMHGVVLHYKDDDFHRKLNIKHKAVTFPYQELQLKTSQEMWNEMMAASLQPERTSANIVFIKGTPGVWGSFWVLFK